MDNRIYKFIFIKQNSKPKNLSNIKFSGLKGQALEIEDKDIPSIKEFQDVIPDQYFKCNTKTSLRYLLQSALIQSLVVAI